MAKKLGIKVGCRVRVINAPNDYRELLSPIPEQATVSGRITTNVDIWHLFTKSSSELKSRLPVLMNTMEQGASIWVSWPKKSSGVPSGVTEDSIRAVALPLGLVDVKVCAIDMTWSALKLVIRKELRK